jgi:RNA polymerase sigma-70 factor (ECF subfamily)
MTDWPAIWREFGPLVWRCAYRILGTDTDSADAFRQTFMAAVDLASRETVRSWPSVLAVLATRQALMLLRTRCRERSRFRPLPKELPMDATDVDPARFAERGELAERLSQALAEMDATQAQLFCRICFEGLSNQEAAKEFGLTPSHVGVLLHRGRESLREKLKAFVSQNEVRP